MSPGIIRHNLRTECFIYELHAGNEALYDEYHQHVWPEVLQALRDSGVTDYSIYRRDNLVVSVWTREVDAPTPVLEPAIQQKVDEWNALTDSLLAVYQDDAGQPLFASRVFHLEA